MKTAQPPRSPPLVQMRRYGPGVYPFLFPSVISSLPQLPSSPHRLQLQQPPSSGSTPSPVDRSYCCLALSPPLSSSSRCIGGWAGGSPLPVPRRALM
uniref:Uncharacterized protein n=1 Tax=Knipowitschia caucasica TaxID=637954 RepID=A0AAV2K2V3_KNICA